MTLAEASLAFSVIGAGVQFAGVQQQAQAAQVIAAQRAETLRQQQATLAQDVTAEKDAERLRQQLLAREGRQQGGRARVASAALGQLVDEGSAADITDDIAAETAFRKALSQHKSEALIRNLGIEAQNIEGNIGAVRLEAAAARDAAIFKSAGTILTAGSTLTRRFKLDETSGDLRFRT